MRTMLIAASILLSFVTIASAPSALAASTDLAVPHCAVNTGLGVSVGICGACVGVSARTGFCAGEYEFWSFGTCGYDVSPWPDGCVTLE